MISTRPLKFRAWDKKEKKWLLGYEYKNLGGFSMLGEMMMMGEYSSLLSSYFPDRLEDIVLMQYTGLKDKNGREIYEGDIIKVFDTERGCLECDEDSEGYDENSKNHIGEGLCENYLCTQQVKWACGYFCDEDTGDYCPPLSDDYLELEVIGNIYENENLLANK